MTGLVNVIWKWRIWKDRQGQDLIEYALMAGFITVGAVASVPALTGSVSTIFSKVGSVLTMAATTTGS